MDALHTKFHSTKTCHGMIAIQEFPMHVNQYQLDACSKHWGMGYQIIVLVRLIECDHGVWTDGDDGVLAMSSFFCNNEQATYVRCLCDAQTSDCGCLWH